ncbi:putative quinol monooxygenase, partial [Rhizobium leguminosarum]|uniref:putative quinol monooxygenase n=1 Tax=Rhizobium leguminosarum TaxID=384 RepID=UPI003F9CC2BA
MKCIVGFFMTKPGKRHAYLAAAQNHLEQSRLDPYCLYIELVPMPEHPDKILPAMRFLAGEGLCQQ